MPPQRNSPRTPSILDDLGEEITGVALPVTICMAVTVFLVRVLNPDGASSGNSVFIASIAYNEQASDSSSRKLSGALLNAIIFVCIIAVMTFVLFLLFKYGCYKVIYAYMGFAVFDIFFLITGVLMMQLLAVGNVHVDVFSLAFILYNFSVVGTLGVLFVPVPLLLKQSYMVWVGIITAYIFTWIPEWTSWVLLALMAVYDIVAVLVPGGPLNALVELAIERQQALPALIYESRPPGGGRYNGSGRWGRHRSNDVDGRSTNTADAAGIFTMEAGLAVGGGPGSSSSHRVSNSGGSAGIGGGRGAARAMDGSEGSAAAGIPAAGIARAMVEGSLASINRIAPLPQRASRSREQELSYGSAVPQMDDERVPMFLEQGGSAQLPRRLSGSSSRGRGRPIGEGSESGVDWKALPGSPEQGGLWVCTTPSAMSISTTVQPSAGQQDSSTLPLISDDTGSPSMTQASGSQLGLLQGLQQGSCTETPDGSPVSVDALLPASTNTPNPSDPEQPAQAQAPGIDEDDGPDGIKLGLGDFIFYSMLVGRAAMYDMMTVFASYMGIVAGLGLTLLCLAVYKRALPALPFSIALGVIFYFLTRLSLEPFIVPMTAHYVYF